MEGYIKLHRKIIEWEWYNDQNTFRLFMHLLIKANHTDANWKGKELKRGQRFTSVGNLSRELSLSEKAIRGAIEKLVKTKEIEITGANKGTMITICKYDSYQSSEETKGQARGRTKGEQGGKQEGEQRARNKNEKNEIKNDIKIRHDEFLKKLSEFKDKYSKDLLNDFYLYWTEKTTDGSKMKFELNETFEIGRRLATWKNRSVAFEKPKQQSVADKNPYHVIQ